MVLQEGKETDCLVDHGVAVLISTPILLVGSGRPFFYYEPRHNKMREIEWYKEGVCKLIDDITPFLIHPEERVFTVPAAYVEEFDKLRSWKKRHCPVCDEDKPMLDMRGGFHIVEQDHPETGKYVGICCSGCFYEHFPGLALKQTKGPTMSDQENNPGADTYKTGDVAKPSQDYTQELIDTINAAIVEIEEVVDDFNVLDMFQAISAAANTGTVLIQAPPGSQQEEVVQAVWDHYEEEYDLIAKLDDMIKLNAALELLDGPLINMSINKLVIPNLTKLFQNTIWKE